MVRNSRRLIAAIVTAAVLWFIMFSPWTSGAYDFWVMMSISAVFLSSLAFRGLGFSSVREIWRGMSTPKGFADQLALGVVIAAALWGVFWIGDFLSQLMFSFAGAQIDRVYAMKDGSNPVVVALLLLFLIGPAEEFFWRGYVQKSLAGRIGDNLAFVVTALVYTLVHIWSFNFMLVMAAMVAGVIWGLLYRVKPQMLPALIISHAIWDACVFVIFPI